MADGGGGYNAKFIRDLNPPTTDSIISSKDKKNGSSIKISLTFELKRSTVLIILRLTVILITLSAAIVMGITKVKRYCQYYVLDRNDPHYYTSSSPYTVNFPELIYFIVINLIASLSALIFFFIHLQSRPSSSNKKTATVCITMEIIAVVLLFSSIGSAWTLRITGDKVMFKPTEHLEAVRCSKVWDFFHQVTIAVSLSTVGGFLYGVLVLLVLKDTVCFN